MNMILGPKESKNKKDKQELFLKKLTHLHLENKGIQVIANLQSCPNIMNLYLQENQIYSLANFPFRDLSKVIQLSLYENHITKMEGF